MAHDHRGTVHVSSRPGLLDSCCGWGILCDQRNDLGLQDRGDWREIWLRGQDSNLDLGSQSPPACPWPTPPCLVMPSIQPAMRRFNAVLRRTTILIVP